MTNPSHQQSPNPALCMCYTQISSAGHDWWHQTRANSLILSLLHSTPTFLRLFSPPLPAPKRTASRPSMDDLLGLSWDQTPSSTAPVGAGGAPGKVKLPPPPPTSKPVHLQMGLSKTGAASMSASSAHSSSSFSAPKKTPDDVFGSLMPSFGKNANVSKNLNAMSLEERRRYDQQQALGSLGSLSSFATLTPGQPTPSYPPSQPTKPTLTPSTNGLFTPGGFDPGNIAGFSKTAATSSPQSAPGIVSPTPRPHQPQPSQQHGALNTLSLNQSSAGLTASSGSFGRSLSPAMVPLQPERSNNSSPAATTSSKDPFGSLLGDQFTRSNPSLKNQPMNSM